MSAADCKAARRKLMQTYRPKGKAALAALAAKAKPINGKGGKR